MVTGRMRIIRRNEAKTRKDERFKVCERIRFWSLRSESSVKNVNTSKCQLALTDICESQMMSSSSHKFNTSLVAWSSPAAF